MARVKMTEKEKQLGQLYKRLKIVLKAYNEGKTYKDYESIIYDLKKQIAELSNNNLSDGILSIRIKTIKNKTTYFDIYELLTDEKIGEAIVVMKGKNGSMNYNFTTTKTKVGYDLRVIKLLCMDMTDKGIEMVNTRQSKENIETNAALNSYGAVKQLTQVTPYNEYQINLNKRGK